MFRTSFLRTLEDISNDATKDGYEGIDYLNALFDDHDSTNHNSHQHPVNANFDNFQTEENQNQNVFNSE